MYAPFFPSLLGCSLLLIPGVTSSPHFHVILHWISHYIKELINPSPTFLWSNSKTDIFFCFCLFACCHTVLKENTTLKLQDKPNCKTRSPRSGINKPNSLITSNWTIQTLEDLLIHQRMNSMFSYGFLMNVVMKIELILSDYALPIL